MSSDLEPEICSCCGIKDFETMSLIGLETELLDLFKVLPETQLNHGITYTAIHGQKYPLYNNLLKFL